MLSGWALRMAEYAEEASLGVSKEGITSVDDIEEQLVKVKVKQPYIFDGTDIAYVFKLKDGRYTFLHVHYGEDQGFSSSFWMAISNSFEDLQVLVKDKYRPSGYITSNLLVFHAMGLKPVGKKFELKSSNSLTCRKDIIPNLIKEYPWMQYGWELSQNKPEMK